MKTRLRKIFSPVLNFFETGNEAYIYKKSHRMALIVVGCLCLLLAFVSLAAALFTSPTGAIIPFSIFFLGGSLCLIIGALGTDRAVAKIWGSR